MAMPHPSSIIERRALLLGSFTAYALLALGGCARSASSSRIREMTMYRDPNCGCCEAWADLAARRGFTVEVIDVQDMARVKRSNGVPDQLASCHTALIDGYVIEGHVPLGAVERLLASRPAEVAGIAVPGMPRGSPGMEMPDGSRDEFEVIAFAKDGRTKLFG